MAGRTQFEPLESPASDPARSRWILHRKPIGTDRVPRGYEQKHGRRRGGRKRHETSTGGGAGRVLFDLAAGCVRLRRISATHDRKLRAGQAAPTGSKPRPPGLFSWWHRGGSQDRARRRRRLGSGTSRDRPAPRKARWTRPPTDESVAGDAIGMDGPQLPSIQPARGTALRPAAPHDAGDSQRRDVDQPHCRSSQRETDARGDGTRSLARMARFDRRKGLAGPALIRSRDRSGSRARHLDDLPFSPTPPPLEVASPEHARAGERESRRCHDARLLRR